MCKFTIKSIKVPLNHTREKKSTAYLFQAIGLAIQRGNAASVIGTIKEDEEETLQEVYLL